MDKEQKKIEAKIRVEIFEFLHKKFMESKDLRVMDILQKLQGEILGLKNEV